MLLDPVVKASPVRESKPWMPRRMKLRLAEEVGTIVEAVGLKISN